MTKSHATDPAVLPMRSIIRWQPEQWVDAQEAWIKHPATII
ncbi:hypothetical protein [Sodalis-like endosymbiont of Proechinophthirus fluctus]|nr:hypothetical protein [Sodalis-like endosymbiont of Proechinophthirus fluctus]